MKWMRMLLVFILILTLTTPIMADPNPPENVPGNPGFEFPGKGKSEPPFTPPPFNESENEENIENEEENNNGNESNEIDDNKNDNLNNKDSNNKDSNEDNNRINYNNLNNSTEHGFYKHEITRVTGRHSDVPDSEKLGAMVIFITIIALLEEVK